MKNNLTEIMTIKREAFMEILKEYYEGEPKTSWDKVLDKVLCEFELYCDDDVSNWLEERYESGKIDSDELLWEFEQFVWTIEDINEFDEEVGNE